MAGCNEAIASVRQLDLESRKCNYQITVSVQRLCHLFSCKASLSREPARIDY